MHRVDYLETVVDTIAYFNGIDILAESSSENVCDQEH